MRQASLYKSITTDEYIQHPRTQSYSINGPPPSPSSRAEGEENIQRSPEEIVSNIFKGQNCRGWHLVREIPEVLLNPEKYKKGHDHFERL